MILTPFIIEPTTPENDVTFAKAPGNFANEHAAGSQESSPERTVGQVTEDEVANTVLEWPESRESLVKMLWEQVEYVLKLAAKQAKRGNVDWELLRPLIILMNLLQAIQISPELKKSTRIAAGLRLFFDSKSFKTGPAENWKVSESISQQARDMYETWEQENWGEPEEAKAARDDRKKSRESQKNSNSRERF
jgi:hypothetical protein